MSKKLTLDAFIKRAKERHGNLYNYNEVVYINIDTKVTIIDPVFGKFKQTPYYHLLGQGHPKRGKQKSKKKQTLTIEEFIAKANKVHKNLYDYSKVKYINSQTKISIIDPEYGAFNIRPNNHLQGQGHPKRGKERTKEKNRLSKAKFVAKSKKIFGDMFDYSEVQYTNMKTKVIIINKKSKRKYLQTPEHHLRGQHPRSHYYE